MKINWTGQLVPPPHKGRYLLASAPLHCSGMTGDEPTIVMDELEQRVLDTLHLIEQADLAPYDALDVTNLFRRIASQRESVMTSLSSMISNLDRVAALLRNLPEVLHDVGQGESREDIAADFANGARAIEAAKAKLQRATRDLDYLQYKAL